MPPNRAARRLKPTQQSTALKPCTRLLHDPDAASRIDYRNVRRVVRALEVFLVTSTPISVLQRKSPPPYRLCQIGLRMERDVLHERINHRVLQMIDAGLQGEVRALLDAGYTWDLPSMSGLGYAQWQPYFAGEQSLEETIAAIQQATRAFARRQMTWFNGHDSGITWLDVTHEPPMATAAQLVETGFCTKDSERSWPVEVEEVAARKAGLPRSPVPDCCCPWW